MSSDVAKSPATTEKPVVVSHSDSVQTQKALQTPSPVGSKTPVENGKKSKPETQKEEAPEGRQNVLSVLIHVIKEIKEPTVENVIKEAQRVKKQKPGKYEAVIRSELVWDDKTRLVAPRLTEAGWKRALTFAIAHDGHHPAIEIFGEEAANKAAAKLDIKYRPRKKEE